MIIFRSILFTVLFIVLIEGLSCWVLLEYYFDFSPILGYEYIVNYILYGLIAFSVLRIVKGSNFFNIQLTDWRYYLIAFLFGATFIFLQAPLNIIYDYLFGTEYLDGYKFSLENLSNYRIYFSFLLVPIYEEFYFRKFIQGDLTVKVNPYFAILFASFLFSIIHLPYYALFFTNYDFTFHRAYITFFGGVISGLLFFKSDSIGPSILMHSMWNLTANLLVG